MDSTLLWCFGIMIFCCFADIESKLNKLLKQNKTDKKKEINLSEYKGKQVSFSLTNDNIFDHMTLYTSDIIGEIIDYDSQWVVYQYHNKKKKETVTQYIRIKDIVSISEIKK